MNGCFPRKRHFIFLLWGLLFLCSVSVFGACGSSRPLTQPVFGNSTRGSTTKVLRPAADGLVTYGNDLVTLDFSHIDQGYVAACWQGPVNKIKLQITGPTNITYTYNLAADGQWHFFPLTAGEGSYTCNVFENVRDNQYSQTFSQTLEAGFADTFLPFLYPNEYVDFNEDTQSVELAAQLASTSDSDLDVISSVFDYVVNNITYDYEKAETVQSGYIPVIDETLSSGTGICFDYAALMASMLRSQQIPTMLEIGYIGDVYHAWISAYVEEQGWLYNIIEFDGTAWHMMDPTFASTKSAGRRLDQYVNNSNYFVKYSY